MELVTFLGLYAGKNPGFFCGKLKNIHENVNNCKMCTIKYFSWFVKFQSNNKMMIVGKLMVG